MIRPQRVLVRTFKQGTKEPILYEANFCCWGLDYDEYESGPGNYSIAIIERDDGTIEKVDPTNIRFVKRRRFPWLSLSL